MADDAFNDSRGSSVARRRICGVLLLVSLAGLFLLPRVASAVEEPGVTALDFVAEGSDCRVPMLLSASRPLVLPPRGQQETWLQVEIPQPGDYAITVEAGKSKPMLTVLAGCGADAIAMRTEALQAEGHSIIRDAVAGQIVKIRVAATEQPGGLTASVAPVVVIQGRVTAETTGIPLQGVYVGAFSADGLRRVGNEGYTDADGRYYVSLRWTASDGGYLLRTGQQNTPTWLHEVWPDAPCATGYVGNLQGCANGLPVLVDSPAKNPVRDFALGKGAIVEGRVLDATTGLPVDSAGIELYGPDSQYLQYVSSDAAGRYRAVGMVSGEVRLRAWSYNFLGQLHDGIPCPYEGCDIDAGTLVPVSTEAPSQVDFHLYPSSFIRINVTVDGVPSLWYRQQFHVARADGTVLQFLYGADGGQLGPLEPGTYFLHARAAGESYGQIYDAIDCDPSCPLDQLPSLGKGIVIAGPGDRPEISMDLRRLPVLRGRVADDTNRPIANATVRVRRTVSSLWSGAATTAVDGTYVIRGMESGSYHVLVDAPRFVDQLHPDVDCESELPTELCAGAQPLSFSVGTDRTVDFELRPSPRVHGTLRGLGTRLPVSWLWNGSLRLYRPDQTELIGTTLHFNDSEGRYALTDYPPGDYYIRSHASTYFHQLADGVNCLASEAEFVCDWQAARLYALGSQDVEVDFDLVPRGRRVSVEASDGSPLPGVAIDVWNQAGYAIGAASTDLDGNAILLPYDETVFLSTDNVDGFVDEVHHDVACPRHTSAFDGGCSLAGATPVALPILDPATPPIVFSLEPDPTVFADGFER